MDQDLILLTRSEREADILEENSLNVEIYSDAVEAAKAYSSGEASAVITNLPYQETREKMEIGGEVQIPIFSAEPSAHPRNFTEMLKGSYEETLVEDGELEVYGLIPAIYHGIEHSPIGITAAIRNEQGDHPLFYVNQGFEDLTGYDRTEALGRDCRFLQGEDTDQDKVAEIRQALEEKEHVQKTIINYDAEGEEFWNELEIWPVQIGDQDVFLGYQRDVTQRESYRKNLELILRILRHDLSNDKAIIDGNLELLKDELEEVPQEIDIIEERLGSMGKKVEKLEQMKNRESSEYAGNIDLYQKVRSSVEGYRDQAEAAGLEVELEDPGREVIVESSPHLNQYFENIIENSIEHHYEDQEGLIEIGWEFEEDSVAVEISDDGPGMDTSQENWGLGLYTINRIADNADIEMDLESDDGLTVRSIFELIEN
ncbi:MAG: PAS domain-containing protein [Candidatus Nanohaloarchaea archaeon]